MGEITRRTINSC